MKNTYNYTCTNKECCSKQQKLRQISTKTSIISKVCAIESFPVTKDEEDVERKENCPECGSEMKMLGEEGGAAFSKLSLMTTEQKQQYFLKRGSTEARQNSQKYKDGAL